MADVIKYLSLTGLQAYDSQIKTFINAQVAAGDAPSFKYVNLEDGFLKFYNINPILEDTVPVYSVELPVQKLDHLMALVEGAVSGNITVFGDGGQVKDSGVALSSLATKEEVNTVSEKVNTNTEAITAINDATTGILAKAKDYADGKDDAIAAAKASGDKAQEDVNALTERVAKNETSIGTLDNLETTNKADLVVAINEVRNAVSVGGTSAAVTVDTTTTTEGYLKSYTFKQGENVIATIDIPKELMAVSGQVVVNPEGMDEGTYIELIIQNGEPVYVNVASLIENYVAKAEATQVQIAIDADTREISAVLVDGGVATEKLADGAVTTIKIADANVTKAKLSTEVQASLDKADAAATAEALQNEISRAQEAEAQALTDAKAYTDEKLAGVDLTGIKTNADAITALTGRMDAAEGEIDTLQTDLDAAEVLLAKKADQTALEAEANARNQAIETLTQSVVALEEKDTTIEGNVTKLQEDVAALQAVEHVEITQEEINAMFPVTE